MEIKIHYCSFIWWWFFRHKLMHNRAREKSHKMFPLIDNEWHFNVKGALWLNIKLCPRKMAEFLISGVILWIFENFFFFKYLYHHRHHHSRLKLTGYPLYASLMLTNTIQVFTFMFYEERWEEVFTWEENRIISEI